MHHVPPTTAAAVVGLGNIGSQIIDPLGRIKGLKRVILIDPDVYSDANLLSQRIRRADVGKAKVAVQAKRLREINPGIEVIAIEDVIANVPRGMLRGAIVLTPLDSFAARRDACEAAWRVGATVIDGGVDPEMGLGRVTVYVPGTGSPCFHCGLDVADYEAMPTKHICADAGEETAPTNGSPSLGALVAALLVVETEKVLAGNMENSLAGKELVVDVKQHRSYVTRLDRNARCRFDHAQRAKSVLAGVSERSTLAVTLAAAGAVMGTNGKVSLGVDGHEFAKALHCPGCGGAKDLFAVPERLPFTARSCAACGGREMLALGFKKLARVSAGDVPARVLRRSLRSLGVRAGDVLVAGDGELENYFEVPHD